MSAVMSSNVAYYEEFAPEYSLFFSDLESNMEKEGVWLDNVLRPRNVVSVLDASCGSGRQAIPLLRRGYRVVGADPSPAMLSEAERQARLLGEDLPLLEAAFVDLSDVVQRRFDAVIALGNGLCNQESREDIRRSLAALRACVQEGGLCLVGIKDFDAVRRERQRFHGHGVLDRDGERTMLYEVWDFADPLLICTAFSVHGHGQTWSVHCAETREYMVGEQDLAMLAREAGFRSSKRLHHPAEAVYALSL